MRNRRNIAGVCALGVALMTAPMLAPPAGGTDAPAKPAGGEDTAMAAISSGDRVIARALFSAQIPSARPEDRMPLEDIADMRRSGRSWLDVFNEMKGRELVAERNLGRLIAKQSSRDSNGALVLSAPPEKDRAVLVEAGFERGADGDTGGQAEEKARPMD